MESYHVCVIGLGELGARIAGELSLYGLKVNVFDSDTNKLKNFEIKLDEQREDLISNGLIQPECKMEVTKVSNLSESVKNVDFIFEAIPDNLEMKQWLYEKITHNCKSDAVICSNTLNQKIEDLSTFSLFKERIIGCRFLFPVYRIPLVELTYTRELSTDTLQKVKDFFNKLDKSIVVRKPGDEARRLTLLESRRYWKECKPIQRLNADRYFRGEIERDLLESILSDAKSTNDSTNTNGHKSDCRVQNPDIIQTTHGKINVVNNKQRHDELDGILRDDYDSHHGEGRGYGRGDSLNARNPHLKRNIVPENAIVYNVQRRDEIDRLMTENYYNEHHGGGSGHDRDKSLNARNQNFVSENANVYNVQRRDEIDRLMTENDYIEHHGGGSGHGRNSTLNTKLQEMSCNTNNTDVDSHKDAIIAYLLQGEEQDEHHGESTGHGRDNSSVRSSTISSTAPRISTVETKKKLDVPKIIVLNKENVHEEKQKNNAENESRKDMMRQECVVCQDAAVNAVLDPCGHMWLCFHCAKIVQDSKKGCPACRCDIVKVLRVYLP